MKKKFMLIAALIAVLLAVVPGAALAAPAELATSGAECAPEMVSGDTVFVYLTDEQGCRPYLVYSETYNRLSRS